MFLAIGARAGEYAGIPICLTKIREIQARQENARIREGIREVNATTAAMMIEQGAAMILPPPSLPGQGQSVDQIKGFESAVHWAPRCPVVFEH